jgi:hypothetical protein
MGTVTLTLDEYEALRSLIGSERESEGASLADRKESPAPKKKSTRSKYNRELSRQLKMLKKKHPRTAMPSLMKRAHRATRKVLKR